MVKQHRHLSSRWDLYDWTGRRETEMFDWRGVGSFVFVIPSPTSESAGPPSKPPSAKSLAAQRRGYTKSSARRPRNDRDPGQSSRRSSGPCGTGGRVISGASRRQNRGNARMPKIKIVICEPAVV